MSTLGRRPKSSLDYTRGGDSGAGRVKVVVRTRPANEFELKEDGNKVCFRVVTKENCMIDVQGKPDPYPFTFDHVFDQRSRQISVFEAAGIPTVDNVLSGFNSTIFAYGQTGAGITHTMVGNIKDEEERGLIPRAFEYLFKRIKEEETTQDPPPQYKVICSNLEIYNETITDLLTPSSTNLPLRNGTKLGSGIYVDGLKKVLVKSYEDAMELMEIGTNSRTVSATNANLTSSRSHCVYTCVITRKQKSEDGSENSRVSRLNLVDLAASERAKVSDEKNAQTLKERCNISKSLTCLGTVIKKLVEAQKKGARVHVPYRDSKLTSLLQESLGGNARTTIIAGVSPMYSSSGESLSTLQFVQRAKHIKNKAKANEVLSREPVALQMEVMKLKAQIEKMKKGGYKPDPRDNASPVEEASCSTPEPDPEMENKIRENEERIEELEAQLEEVQSDSDRAVERNREMQEEISTLRTLKTELQTDMDRATAKANEFETDNAGLKEQITILEETRSEVKKKLGETERQVQQLERERQDLQNEVECWKHKSGDLESKLAEANEQRKDQRAHTATTQSELYETVVKADEFETQNAGLKQTIETLAENRSDLRKKLNDTELIVQKLEREKQDLGSEVECKQQKCTYLDSKLAEAREKAKELRAQLVSRENEVEQLNGKVDESEADNVGLKQTIESLEHNRSELKKRLNETELVVQKLERQKQDLDAEVECWQNKGGDLDTKLADAYNQLKEQRTQITAHVSELERNEQQRVELQSEVDHYEPLSKVQREEAAAVKARFDRTLFEHREVVSEKDAEIRRIEANCQSQIAAKDAKLAECMKRHEEVLHKCQEQYEAAVASLRASIQEIEEERENEKKQFIEDKKELETSHKAAIEEFRKSSEDSDKQWSHRVEELVSTVHRKENELRDMTAKFKSEMNTLRCRLEEETSKSQALLSEQETTSAEELFQIKQDSTKQVLLLEDSVRKYKQLVAEKQTVIEFHESQIKEMKAESEIRLKKEIEKCRTDFTSRKLEADELNVKAENQNNAKFRKYEDEINSLQRELDSRDSRLNALEEQLEAKEGINTYYYEDCNNTLNRMTNVNNTLLSVLESINATLCEIEISRPGSVASSCHIDDDGGAMSPNTPRSRSYESEYPSIGCPMSSTRLSGRYPSSNYCESAFFRYPTPLQY